MHFSELFTHCPTCGSNKFVQNNEKSKRCESCGFVFYVNPSAAVAAFIVNEASELLVCKRGKEPKKGTWDLPGGFVDGNETAEAALIREIDEELQVKVVEYKYIFSLPNLYEYSRMTIPTLDMFFTCKIAVDGQLTPSDDVADCFFVPLKDVKTENFGLKSIQKGVGMFLKDNTNF